MDKNLNKFKLVLRNQGSYCKCSCMSAKLWRIS